MAFIEILKEQWLKTNKYFAMALCSTTTMIWILPPLIHHFVYDTIATVEISFFICFVALFLLLLQTFFHTLTQLQQLYKERDIALHVPIPLEKIICSRLINSLCVHTMVLCMILFSMMFTLLHEDYSIRHILSILALLFFVLFYSLMTAVALALLAFPLWHICRDKLGGFAYLLFPLSAIGILYVLYTFEHTSFYAQHIALGIKYSDFIPIDETPTNKFLNVDTFYQNVYVIENTLICIFTVICFFIGMYVTKRIITK